MIIQTTGLPVPYAVYSVQPRVGATHIAGMLAAAYGQGAHNADTGDIIARMVHQIMPTVALLGKDQRRPYYSKFASAISKAFGPEVFVLAAQRGAYEAGVQLVFISGIRVPGQVDYIKQCGGNTIRVDSSVQAIRYRKEAEGENPDLPIDPWDSQLYAMCPDGRIPNDYHAGLSSLESSSANLATKIAVSEVIRLIRTAPPTVGDLLSPLRAC